MECSTPVRSIGLSFELINRSIPPLGPFSSILAWNPLDYQYKIGIEVLLYVEHTANHSLLVIGKGIDLGGSLVYH